MPLALYIKVETGDAARERKERMIDGQPCVCAPREYKKYQTPAERKRERANKTQRCSLRSERAEKKVINYFYTFFHLSLTGVRNKLRWKVKSFLPLSFLC
jgi:hypothetical protein